MISRKMVPHVAVSLNMDQLHFRPASARVFNADITENQRHRLEEGIAVVNARPGQERSGVQCVLQENMKDRGEGGCVIRGVIGRADTAISGKYMANTVIWLAGTLRGYRDRKPSWWDVCRRFRGGDPEDGGRSRCIVGHLDWTVTYK